MNIKSAINKGKKILKQNFILSSSLDSEILLAKVLNKDRKYILFNPNKLLNKNNIYNFEKLIEKRSLKKPISYLTNKKNFSLASLLINLVSEVLE